MVLGQFFVVHANLQGLTGLFTDFFVSNEEWDGIPNSLAAAVPSDEESVHPLALFPICPNCQGAKVFESTNLSNVRKQSCNGCNALKFGMDYKQLAQDQQSDHEIQAYRTATTSLKVQDVPRADGQLTVLCDVPLNWRRHVLFILISKGFSRIH